MLLFLLVVPMAWRMVVKARSMHARETAARREAARSFTELLTPPVPHAGAGKQGQLPADAPRDATEGSLDLAVQLAEAKDADAPVRPGSAPSHPGSTSSDPETGCCARDASDAAVLARLQRDQARLLPPLQVGLLVLTLAYVAAASLMAGLLLECGSGGYYALSLSPVLLMAAVWAVARRRVLRDAAHKARLGLLAPGDLTWTPRSTVVFPAICACARLAPRAA